MRERGRGGRRGCRAGEGSEAAHSSPPARAPPPRPGRPGPSPLSEERPQGRGRAPRWTPPQITKLPPTPPTKLRSHRAAPGAPPRAESEQLRTFVAEKTIGVRYPGGGWRLAAAAAEAKSLHHRGPGGVQELLPRLLQLRSGCEHRRPPTHAPQAARGRAGQPAVTPMSPPESKRGAKVCELGLHDRAARQAP